MPRDRYYHKHLLYNVGLIVSRGRVVTFCDSDAMFSEDSVDHIAAHASLLGLGGAALSELPRHGGAQLPSAPTRRSTCAGWRRMASCRVGRKYV